MLELILPPIANAAPRTDPLDVAAQALTVDGGDVVRPYSTRDFGRARYDRARSMLVDEARALDLLKQMRAKLATGYVAFIGTNSSLADPPVTGVEIVVAPAQDQFDILRIAASDAVNFGMQTEDLIRVLSGWNTRFGIDIYGAATDAIQLRLQSRPADLQAFAREVYAFCPDIVDQADGSIETLVQEIETTQTLFLWWDCTPLRAARTCSAVLRNQRAGLLSAICQSRTQQLVPRAGLEPARLRTGT